MEELLEKILNRFEKAGYMGVNWKLYEVDDKLTQLDIILALSDDWAPWAPDEKSEFDLEKEWSKLKKAASSSGYYIVPSWALRYTGPCSVANVSLIRKDLIYGMTGFYAEMYRQVNSSYWAVQGDDLIAVTLDKLIILHDLIRGIHGDIKRMNTGTKHVELFDDVNTYRCWIQYCIASWELKGYTDILAKDKVPVEVRQRINESNSLLNG